MLMAEDWTILATSLGVATRAVAFSLPLAVAVAWALSRPRFPGKTMLDGLSYLPLALPPVLVGFLLLMALGRQSPLGGWLEQSFGLRLAFTAEGAALATAVMTFPLMVRSIRVAFELADRGMLEAAAMLRAGPWDRFATVALPLASPGVLAGAVVGFAAGLGEFGAVISFAGNVPGETQTLPLAIYSALQTPGGEGRALRLGMVSLGIAILGILASEGLLRWARRRAGA